MNRAKAIANAESYLASGAFEQELGRLVAVPTESQTEEGLPHCRRYLTDEMVPIFESLGFSCKILDNPAEGCGPALLATRIEDEGLPIVLGYGHGDVIRGLEDKWTKGAGPWKLFRDGERLYGRGTADNKGQHLINVRALDVVLQSRGQLGFNAKFLIETGEENGSRGLREIIAAHREAFAADLFVASDGPRVSSDRPTIFLGNRGAINFDLVCSLHEGAHHSGNWGGAIADPAAVLAHALSTIVSPNGQIQVPEWRPAPPSPLVRQLLEDVELNGGPGPPVTDPEWGEPDLSPAENVYAWNSFAVLAMSCGMPESPVNAIAPSARAHCQLRFIKGTDPEDILPALQRHLDKHGFGGRVTVAEPDSGNSAGFAASRTEPNHPHVSLVRGSLERTNGRPPAVLPQMGGSICNDLFTDLLGLPAIWIPHAYPGCSQHAPDEHILLPTCRNALALMTGLYWDLGEARWS